MTPEEMAMEYRLSGPQVEPEASYWNRCPLPCPVSLEELIAVTDDESNPRFFPPFPTDPDVVQEEFEELRDLERRRDDPTQVVSTAPGRVRCPISTFLQLRPPPLGAVFNYARGDNFPVIFTGRELARYFENETPGLAHRQALNYLLRETNRDARWSPPRQALVWAALDVALYSALSAAWYYKWLSPRENVARRQRPHEYAVDNGLSLDVLFDRTVNSTGSGDGPRRPNFPPVPNFIRTSPGTPRHPAYPSGHSTYAGAGSEILSYFFPDYRQELDRLADNTGLARLWAGIHWRSDHVEGMKLGRTVACLVIEQLRSSGIDPVPVPPEERLTQTPPTIDELEGQAAEFEENCGNASPDEAPGPICPASEPCVEPGPPPTG